MSLRNSTIGYCKDQYLIDAINKQDSELIYRCIQKYDVSACGYGPIMTLIEYAKLIVKSPEIELLSRGNSGEIFSSHEVIDYASFLCYE